jgi:thiol reductant ABC exporter CydD subunit
LGQRFWRENPPARRRFGVAVGLAWLAAAVGLAFLVVLGGVVGRVFVGHQRLGDVAQALVLMVALAGARAALIWTSAVLGQGAADGVKRDLRERLAGKLIALGPAYARGKRTGELVHVATQGVESLDEHITRYLPARLLAGLVPALVLLVVARLDPWTLPVLLFTGPLLLVLLALIGGRTREQARRREGELAWMSAHFLDLLQGLATLKMFGRGPDQAATIGAVGRRYGDTVMDVLRTAFQTSLVLEWGATAATALVAIEVSFRLMHGLMPFDRALAVLLVTPECFLPLRQLAVTYHAGAAGKAGAERVYALLDTPLRTVARAAAPAAARWLPARPDTGFDLRFDDVYLAYDGGQRPALAGFSLAVGPGQRVALVGASGAGKTTVANLLLRFVEPDRGEITVDGFPLGELDPVFWRTLVAWVPQHPHLFAGTVADNLRLAKPDATAAEVVAAARAAHAHEFVARLPAGYDTPLGERGARLSGGQAQRLALARAFLKDAPLLVLDEATSHLDTVAEALVNDALAAMMDRRTVLVISHRPALVAAAQVVAVMERGRVVETIRQGAPRGPIERELERPLALSASGARGGVR